MKKTILALVMFFAIMACEDENVQPTEAPDLFVGSWSYTYPNVDAMDLKVSFDVVKGGDAYQFNNIHVHFPSEISANDALEYEIEVRDKFEANDGFGFIRINGGGETNWIFIDLTYNTIYKQKAFTYHMTAHEMKITTQNDAPIILENQTFVKIEQ